MADDWKQNDQEMPQEFTGDCAVWTPRRRGDWRSRYEV